MALNRKMLTCSKNNDGETGFGKKIPNVTSKALMVENVCYFLMSRRLTHLARCNSHPLHVYSFNIADIFVFPAIDVQRLGVEIRVENRRTCEKIKNAFTAKHR